MKFDSFDRTRAGTHAGKVYIDKTGTLVVEAKVVEDSIRFDGDIKFIRPCKVRGFVKSGGTLRCVSLTSDSFIVADRIIASRHIAARSYIRANLIESDGYIRSDLISGQRVEAGWFIEAEKIMANNVYARKAIIAKEIEAETVISETSNIKAEKIRCRKIRAVKIEAVEVVAEDVKAQKINIQKWKA
jgi:hypothetical protein